MAGSTTTIPVRRPPPEGGVGLVAPAFEEARALLEDTGPLPTDG
jgi:hypothetical protein